MVTPAFNEAESLEILAREIDQALKDVDHEVIFVDDGSRDAGPAVLADLRSRDPRVRVLTLPKNQGQSAALAVGFKAVRAPVVVTLDSDLQNDPADIPQLIEALATCDMVSGVRVVRRDTLARRWASWFANRFRDRVLKDSVQDVGCSLKAYRAELVLRLKMFDGMHRFLPALIALQGARIRNVPVSHRPRIHGPSKYSIGRRLLKTIPDLLAVVWMRGRWIDESAAVELGCGAEPGAGQLLVSVEGPPAVELEEAFR